MDERELLSNVDDDVDDILSLLLDDTNDDVGSMIGVVGVDDTEDDDGTFVEDGDRADVDESETITALLDADGTLISGDGTIGGGDV
jgi:hypothetical protein